MLTGVTLLILLGVLALRRLRRPAAGGRAVPA
jgi:hypothetical protein